MFAALIWCPLPCLIDSGKAGKRSAPISCRLINGAGMAQPKSYRFRAAARSSSCLPLILPIYAGSLPDTSCPTCSEPGPRWIAEIFRHTAGSKNGGGNTCVFRSLAGRQHPPESIIQCQVPKGSTEWGWICRVACNSIRNMYLVAESRIGHAVFFYIFNPIRIVWSRKGFCHPPPRISVSFAFH